MTSTKPTTTPATDTEDAATRAGPMHVEFAKFLNEQHGAGGITPEQVFLVTSKRKAFRSTTEYRTGVKAAQEAAKAAEAQAKEKARQEREAARAKAAEVKAAAAAAKKAAQEAAAAQAAAAEAAPVETPVAPKPTAKPRMSKTKAATPAATV